MRAVRGTADRWDRDEDETMTTETIDRTPEEIQHIAEGIERSFRHQSTYASERRDEAFRWLEFWREKLRDVGATTDRVDAIEEEAKALISQRLDERLEAIAAKRPETYAGYGLDYADFDETGCRRNATPGRMVDFDDDEVESTEMADAEVS